MKFLCAELILAISLVKYLYHSALIEERTYVAKENKYDGTEIKIMKALRPFVSISRYVYWYNFSFWSASSCLGDWQITPVGNGQLLAVHPDNSISVEWSWYSCEPSSSEKIPTLEVVLTILHAGGRIW